MDFEEKEGVNLDSYTKQELKEIIRGFLEREEELKSTFQELEKAADGFKDKWMRTAADFDNYKKRNLESTKRAFEEGKSEAVIRILGIGDNLERALKLDLDLKTKDGLELVYKQFADALAALDIASYGEAGETFDPNFHEAFVQAEGAEEDSGKISEVYLKGYKQNDKVIRYAQVAVFK